MAVMPFLIANAPVLNGNAKAFLARAAAGELVSVGRPADCWLNRPCLFRAGAVDQPYLTPRFATSGRKVSGRRNVGGNCAQLVGSLGAISRRFVDDLVL